MQTTASLGHLLPSSSSIGVSAPSLLQKLLFLILLYTLNFVHSLSLNPELEASPNLQTFCHSRVKACQAFIRIYHFLLLLIIFGMLQATAASPARPVYSGSFYWAQVSGRTAAVLSAPASQALVYIRL